MNLEDLAEAEQKLLWQVESVTGSIEEKDEQLERLGVYSEYAKIYQAYAALISSDKQNPEALKRAVFLSWYQFAEPSCFSGLRNLPEQITNFIYEALEQKIKHDELDFELKFMLPFYHAVRELPFSLYPQLSHLQSFLRTANPDLWRSEITRNELFLRGQMGEYWLTIEDEGADSYLNAG